MKRFSISKRSVCLIALAAASLCGIATAQDSEDAGARKIKGVAAGSDFLSTGQPTQVQLMGQTIRLMGVPIVTSTGEPLGNADTIMQRPQDAMFVANAFGAVTTTVPLTLAALQLTGTLGTPPNACTMNITIQGSPASTGTATLKATSATGGTYTATFNVNYVATFTPIPPNTTCPATVTGSKGPLTLKGGVWTTTPPPGALVVTGAYPNPNVNMHTGLPRGFFDFYPSPKLQTHLAVIVKHSVCQAQSTPGTLCQ